MSIQLPHEVVKAILAISDKEKLLQRDGLEPRDIEHLQRVAQEFGENADELLALGFWCDGVPFNWDRSQSVEVLSFNFPGLKGEWENLRIPITCVPKNWVATDETFEDLLEVVLWSLQCLAVGQMPDDRHDRSGWKASDKWRAKHQGEAIGVKAFLVEIRGDWLMMKEVFHLPGWRDNTGCCWLCHALPADVARMGLDAEWRRNRLTHWQLLERILRLGHNLSPLMRAPGVRSWLFKIDWLHAVDQGVGADFLGNVLFLLCRRMEGRHKKTRLRALLLEINTWYNDPDNHVTARLHTLTEGMIKKQKAPPKLRGKAAECRALIPFAEFAARKWFDDADPEQATAKQMAIHLNALYGTLSGATIFREDLMREHCRKFMVLYSGLSQSHGGTTAQKWKIKPKFHLVQELCEMTTGAIPACSWTYRDEDFGGSVARATRKKGNSVTPSDASRNYLDKFVAQHRLPSIM